MESRFDLKNILLTAVRVVTSPSGFFRDMPKTGGYLEPLLFMLVMGFIGAMLQALFGMSGLQDQQLDIDALSLILFLTIMIVISGFVAAAIYFVIWRVMGSQESFETAYRCNAYISALIPITTVLSLLPTVAPFISILLSTVFLVIASVHVHRLPSQKSWIVFGLLGLLFMMFFKITGHLEIKDMGGDQGIQRQFQESPGRNDDTLEDLKRI